MEERLKNLKKIMNQRTFNTLTFTDEHQEKIRRKINGLEKREEDIQLAILQLLNQAKTGYELTSQLRGRGILQFENNEGSLYTLLHRLEQSGFLSTDWNDVGAKYYQLNHKGKKLLKRAEQKQMKQSFILKEWFEG